jgi:hypothetical protein
MTKRERILNLWAAHTLSKVIAFQCDTTERAVRSVVCDARRGGDPRAVSRNTLSDGMRLAYQQRAAHARACRAAMLRGHAP